MRITTIVFLLLALSVIALSAYFSKKKKRKTRIVDPVPTATFPYRVNSPTQAIELPHKLGEVSDLSFDTTTNALWAIADEHGELFRISLSDTSQIDAFPFGEDGDYEGVELVGDTVYAMESNGRITRIQNATTANPQTAIFEIPSMEGNDIESFMYDPVIKKLVLGVKTPKKGKDSRAFYSFDIATTQLDPQPLFVVSLEDIQAFLRENGLAGEYYEQWLKKKADMPSPSAIAIHPGSGHYFILCSIGKTLLVTKPNGEILQVIALDNDLHTKPEGIAFGPDGNMYISNEGDGGVAKLLVFAPQ